VKHGFDQFKGFISGNIDAYSHRDQESVKDWWHGEKLTKVEGYHTDLINSHSIQFIEENKDKPFFLYVSHGAPHYPFQARASKIQRGPRKGTVHESAPKETYSDNPGDEDFLMRHFVLPVDEGVGMIRKKVEELGIADNTMIWFISDNGADPHNYTKSAQTRNSKGSFYEGGHRVPAILWAPDKVKAGSVSDELMLTFDLMPTTLQLAGVETPDGFTFDGADLAPVLFSNEALPERTILWNRRTRGALRRGDYKLVVHSKNGADELFDNIAKQNAEKVTELRDAYNALVSETREDSPYKEISSKKKGRGGKGSGKRK